jgi:hypothetical protein
VGITMPIGRRRFRGGSYNITGHWEALRPQMLSAQWQSEAAYSLALEA